MSCQHGNWPPCDHCDEIDAAVAHATAARDAEVEALRAEVEQALACNRGLTRLNEATLERAERLAEALRAAEKSLRTIADCAGLTKRIENASDVRGYANSRANAARAALEQERGRG